MLWRIVIKIFDDSVSDQYARMTLVFAGQSEAEAEQALNGLLAEDEHLRGIIEGDPEETGLVVARHVVPPVDDAEHPARSGDLDEARVDPIDLRLGALDELEHTDDIDEATDIAVTHLLEDPTYYDKLVLGIGDR